MFVVEYERGEWHPRSDWKSNQDALNEADRLNGVVPHDDYLNSSHVYTHSDRQPRVNVKAERNSRGYNYEATVTDATSVEEALAMLDKAINGLCARFESSE